MHKKLLCCLKLWVLSFNPHWNFDPLLLLNLVTIQMWWYFDSQRCCCCYYPPPHHLFSMERYMLRSFFDLDCIDGIIHRLYDTHIGGSRMFLSYSEEVERGTFQ